MSEERVRRLPKADARPKEVRAKTLVVTEGTDEERLVFHLLRRRRDGIRVYGESIPGIRGLREITELESGELDVQIVDIHGRAQISTVASWLPIVPGFALVERLIVLFDAEDDADNSFAIVSSAILKMGFPRPDAPWREAITAERVSIACILPFGGTSGCLESLINEVLRSDPTNSNRFACADSFLTCLSIISDTDARHEKRLTNAWLLGHRDPGIRLGAAFDQDMPLDDARFDPIVNAILGAPDH